MTNNEIELQALIAKCKGMDAENQHCIYFGLPIKYTDSAFDGLSEKMRALKTEEPSAEHCTGGPVRAVHSMVESGYGVLCGNPAAIATSAVFASSE